MARKQYLVGGAAALIVAAVITGCTDSKQITKEVGGGPALPELRVAREQHHRRLSGRRDQRLDAEANRTPCSSRSRRARASRSRRSSMPGCAPPVDTFPSHRVTPPGYPPSTASSCYLRVASSVTPVVNNVAVPGAASIDPVTLTTANSNALTHVHPGRRHAGLARGAGAARRSFRCGSATTTCSPAALSGVLVAGARCARRASRRRPRS